MSEVVKILFIGDVIGRPGRRAVREMLGEVIERFSPDMVIANGENAAGGFGITPEVSEELLGLGVDVITSGNHIWDKKEILEYIEDSRRLIRPANYPPGCPGRGSTVIERNGIKVGVMNLGGRIFMDPIDCPFRAGRVLAEELSAHTKVIIVDMHAEATSEKTAMGFYLDGSVSAVIGTHTHVQTADERILPRGTAYITDSGMTGPTMSVIGIDRHSIINRFLTRMPTRFEVAAKGVEFQGVVVTVDPSSGKALSIERIKTADKRRV